jgi:hypothetical protein
LKAGPALIALALCGCASWPVAGTVEAGSVAEPAAPAPAAGTERTDAGGPGAVPEAPTAPVYHPAGVALLEQARGERSAGDADRAGATLERALRVDADNPWIWIELARLRMDAGRATAAEGMARKAFSLATRDEAARSEARVLINAAGAGP